MSFTFSQKKIKKLFAQRKLEDPDLINDIDLIFKKKRNFVVKIPNAGEAVILLVSGGLDSIILWSFLIEEYQLQVYPIFFRRGQRRVAFEESAVDFYSDLFKKKYPNFWHPVKKMNAFIPPMEIRFPITIASQNPIGNKGQWRSIPVYSNLLFSYACQYGYYLELVEKIHTRTIFGGFMYSDGLVMKEETLTAMRAVNLSLCMLTDDFSWQVIALPIEKELGFAHDKHHFVGWANQHQLPLKKTRSCIMWNKHHCGNCISCHVRQVAFKKAGLEDETFYINKHGIKARSNYFYRQLKLKIKRVVKKVLK